MRSAFSGFFRTYNLALFSNFGEGLIRQSEFRTVEGAEARETHTFSPWLEAMAGVLYNEDDIHNDNLDHYLSDHPQRLRPLRKGAEQQCHHPRIRSLPRPPRQISAATCISTPDFATDQIQMINTDKISRAYSFNERKAVRKSQGHRHLVSRHRSSTMAAFRLLQPRPGLLHRRSAHQRRALRHRYRGVRLRQCLRALPLPTAGA